MSLYDSNSEPKQNWESSKTISMSPVRQDLLRWFQKEAPSLAPAYEGAVQILNMPTLPARVHLVSHIARDIISTLPEILNDNYRRINHGKYHDLVNKVEANWEPINEYLPVQGNDEDLSSETHEVSISITAAKCVELLLEHHDALKKQKRSSEVLSEALYHRFAESGMKYPQRLSRVFEHERRWFSSRAHLVLEERKLHTDEGLIEHFTTLENALHSLVGKFFVGKKEIDVVLEETNQ